MKYKRYFSFTNCLCSPFSADFTYQSVEQTHQSHAAVNYYSKTNVHGGHLNVAHKSANLFLIDGVMLKLVLQCT